MSHSYSASKPAVSLRGLLANAVFVGAEDIVVRRCRGTADRCKRGDVFIPQPGGRLDQHERVDEAIRLGASAVVTERLLPVSVPQCLVPDNRIAYAQVCQAIAGHPSNRMLSLAVVGTQGKTTTSLFLSAMLKRIGGQVAYYTTLGSSDSKTCDRSSIRPPSAAKLARWMQRADQASSPSFVLEMAQPMLQHHVTLGAEFDLLVLTGLRPSQDVGGLSASRYRRALETLAEQMKPHAMLLYNADDPYAARWATTSGMTAIGYGLDASHDIRAKRLSRSGGQQQLMVTAGNVLMPLTLNIPGDHVARAALAAIAAAWTFDLSVPEAVAGAESLKTIPGRMQRIAQSVDLPVFIDQGYSPDRVATSLHSLRQHQFGSCTAVVDVPRQLHPQQRARLGEVLERSAYKVVLSAADCSAQQAQSRLMDVLGGFSCPGRVEVIPNRRRAIQWAFQNSHSGCVLLAGCGTKAWMHKHERLTDEAVAQQAIAAGQRPKSLSPMLGVFPPPNSGSFFSH